MLTRAQKQKIIEELSEKISRQKSLVFAEITGLKTKELFDLKNKLKEEGSEIKVAKKNLIKNCFRKTWNKNRFGKINWTIRNCFWI